MKLNTQPKIKINKSKCQQFSVPAGAPTRSWFENRLPPLGASDAVDRSKNSERGAWPMIDQRRPVKVAVAATSHVSGAGVSSRQQGRLDCKISSAGRERSESRCMSRKSHRDSSPAPCRSWAVNINATASPMCSRHKNAAGLVSENSPHTTMVKQA